ncbi:hypothetical protein [Bacillus sp. NPDC094106]|uniref:hypothetical protein n=1 Tax=Bacillus sp. NPDC094106 TaxID=3363949 RepID=UPI0038287755
MNEKIVIMEYSNGQLFALFKDKTRRSISRGELWLIKLAQQHRKNSKIEYVELTELEVTIRLGFIRRFMESNTFEGSEGKTQLNYYVERMNFYHQYGIISDKEFEEFINKIEQ